MIYSIPKFVDTYLWTNGKSSVAKLQGSVIWQHCQHVRALSRNATEDIRGEQICHIYTTCCTLSLSYWLQSCGSTFFFQQSPYVIHLFLPQHTDGQFLRCTWATAVYWDLYPILTGRQMQPWMHWKIEQIFHKREWLYKMQELEFIFMLVMWNYVFTAQVKPSTDNWIWKHVKISINHWPITYIPWEIILKNMLPDVDYKEVKACKQMMAVHQKQHWIPETHFA